ncbi:hypothetical protein B0H19DRAFT_1253805 [Mycena capillaripes]|nr:hypothetical protein B0H19DRAFT_1253805 [Mycena capillaripes]
MDVSFYPAKPPKKAQHSRPKGVYHVPSSKIWRAPARRPEAAPPSKALTRIRYRTGKRDKRDVPLTEDDLYVGQARPPVRNSLNGHKCRICGCIKSNPVTSACGHSYCYVCIRLRLETEWTCPYPDCHRVLHTAPKPDLGEKESARADYPGWEDESEVRYSWEGLRFPRAPKPIELSPPPSPF